jgi:tetratricopeptide (TPR) repeat protein
MNKAEEFYKAKLYFTASSYIKIYVSKDNIVTSNDVRLFDKVIERTNVFPFLDLNIETLKKLNDSENIHFLIGKKYLIRKKFKKAIEYFHRVSRKSPFYIQSQFHLAGLYLMGGNKKYARKYINRCIKAADRQYDIIPKDPVIGSAKIDHIKEMCEIFYARNEYKNGSRSRSILFYDKTESNAYTFPQSLFENSWNHYIKRKYNLSIGKNLTFQAPILDNYFIPETELVKALSYIDLCQYKEASKVIKNFDKNIRKKVKDFKKRFKLGEKAKFPFMRLIFNKQLKKEMKDNFHLKLVNVILVNPHFKTIMHYLEKIRSEKKRMKKYDKFKGASKKAYYIAYNSFAEFFDGYVKKKFVDYTNDIINLNNKFIEIELEIYSNLKYELYKNKKSGKNDDERETFFVKEIDRETDQYYWDFNGEFWADELGNYIPILENKCGKKKIKKRKKKKKKSKK